MQSYVLIIFLFFENVIIFLESTVKLITGLFDLQK